MLGGAGGRGGCRSGRSAGRAAPPAQGHHGERRARGLGRPCRHLPPPRRRVAAPPPVAIAEGPAVAAAPEERWPGQRGAARGHLSPPLPAGHGDVSPAAPQTFCRFASPLGDVKASGLPPPALHVEAVAGILERLWDARGHEAMGHRHFRAVRVVSRRKNATVWPLVTPGAYLRDGERVKMMQCEQGRTMTDQRPSPAVTAELLMSAELQPEGLPSQDLAVRDPSPDILKNGSDAIWCHML
ncbi:uncharacterized protein LOC131582779 [Poecile atricapillus]|uniref:uncharacterized protein LOC131582779 n=1 Tax=Poecile atricapillus TaxID=48891 RepID=UPI00273A0CF2|nr:uncharacterized protein LOC131582779 [Poecile atricapillus]